MSPSETYVLVTLKNPDGILLSDIFYIEGGRRRPVIFKKVGETIDLSKIDVKSFVTSAKTGILAQMEKSGSLMRVQQETSVRRADELNSEWERQSRVYKPVMGNSSTAQVILLEPGLQVAVGGGHVSHVRSSELEPGVYGPPSGPEPQAIFAGASSSSHPEELAVEVPVVDDGIGAVRATTGVSLYDADNAPRQAAVRPQVADIPAEVSWKDNLTLADQEDFIRASTDKKFLQSILDDAKESKKMKNLAKKTLAALE